MPFGCAVYFGLLVFLYFSSSLFSVRDSTPLRVTLRLPQTGPLPRPARSGVQRGLRQLRGGKRKWLNDLCHLLLDGLAATWSLWATYWQLPDFFAEYTLSHVTSCDNLLITMATKHPSRHQCRLARSWRLALHATLLTTTKISRTA